MRVEEQGQPSEGCGRWVVSAHHPLEMLLILGGRHAGEVAEKTREMALGAEP